MLGNKSKFKIVSLAVMLSAAFMLTACTASASAAVPSQALSQQQIEEQQTAMKYYCDTYGDIYAALVMRDMYEAGQITQNDYSGAYSQAGNALGKAETKELHKLHDVLNCSLTRLSEKNLLKDRVILTETIKRCPVLISIFDTQQQRDEVESAIKTIDEWAASPDDGHTKSMENEIESEKLSCGAKVYLYYYLSGTCRNVESVCGDGETYDITYYLEDRLGGYIKDALLEMLMQNNGPKADATEADGS